jgi:hypothetical protein
MHHPQEREGEEDHRRANGALAASSAFAAKTTYYVATLTLDNPYYQCPPYRISSPTYDAQVNYQESQCFFFACPGDTVMISACGSKAGGYGDTYFRLYDDDFFKELVGGVNDNSCGSLSQIGPYTLPPTADGNCRVYSLHQGCAKFAINCGTTRGTEITIVATAAPTSLPTAAPSAPTALPSATPTGPTSAPTAAPTASPTSLQVLSSSANPYYQCPPYSVTSPTDYGQVNTQGCLFTVCPYDTITISACGNNAGGYGNTCFRLYDVSCIEFFCGHGLWHLFSLPPAVLHCAPNNRRLLHHLRTATRMLGL